MSKEIFGDFTKYKNIGKKLHNVFAGASLTIDEFEELDTAGVILRLVELGEAEYFLKYPSILYQVIWGAKNDVLWGAVPSKIKAEAKQFASDLRSSFGA